MWFTAIAAKRTNSNDTVVENKYTNWWIACKLISVWLKLKLVACSFHSKPKMPSNYALIDVRSSKQRNNFRENAFNSKNKTTIIRINVEKQSNHIVCAYKRSKTSVSGKYMKVLRTQKNNKQKKGNKYIYMYRTHRGMFTTKSKQIVQSLKVIPYGISIYTYVFGLAFSLEFFSARLFKLQITQNVGRTHTSI